jgi:hypothetical protein
MNLSIGEWSRCSRAAVALEAERDVGRERVALSRREQAECESRRGKGRDLLERLRNTALAAPDDDPQRPLQLRRCERMSL